MPSLFFRARHVTSLPLSLSAAALVLGTPATQPAGAGVDGMSAGSIAEALDVPAATLSFHLKELKACGVADCRRDGRTLIYSPSFEAMNELLAYLTENCCAGDGGCS